MRWITNTVDPRDPYAPMYVARGNYESYQEAWEHHMQFLSDKIIGEPKATSMCTVEQLKEMKMVGVYLHDDEPANDFTEGGLK